MRKIYNSLYGNILVDNIEGINIVRDDLVKGGTKCRILPTLLEKLEAKEEVVYASPAYGYAQIALAHAAKKTGRQATIFVAKRKQLHKRTAEAQKAGAKIVEVEAGYLTVIQARSREYAKANNATLIPFGLDTEDTLNLIAEVAKAIPEPKEVWTVAGSGTLSRALQKAFPNATFYAIQVGATPNVNNAILYKAEEKFENDAKNPPPFPSCSNYDAKAWKFIKQHASKDALFWNVAA